MKWPILDSAGNAMHDIQESGEPLAHKETMAEFSPLGFCPAAQPLQQLPLPPVPKIIQSFVSSEEGTAESENPASTTETLNPDVPEFIPILLTDKVPSDSTKETVESAAATSEAVVAKQLDVKSNDLLKKKQSKNLEANDVSNAKVQKKATKVPGEEWEEVSCYKRTELSCNNWSPFARMMISYNICLLFPSEKVFLMTVIISEIFEVYEL